MKIEQAIVATTTMLQMQHDVNVVMNKTEDWVSLNRPWYRAIWTEASEIVTEWVDWEWWKKGQVSVYQAQLELVDIFHFILSNALQNRDPDEESFEDVAYVVATQLYDQLGKSAVLDLPEDIEGLCGVAERFINDTIEFHQPDLGYFADLMNALDFSFEALYMWYIGKNQLNHFRQGHGDKEGTYVRNWVFSADGDTVADNACLENIVTSAIKANMDTDGFADHVTKELDSRWEIHLSYTGENDAG